MFSLSILETPSDHRYSWFILPSDINVVESICITLPYWFWCKG